MPTASTIPRPARFAGAGLAFFPKSFVPTRDRCYNGGYRRRGTG